MTSPPSASRAASFPTVRTPGSPPNPLAKANVEESKSIASAPQRPRSNEGYEILMNWEHAESSDVVPKTSGPPPSLAERCPSAPVSSLNIIADPAVEVKRASGISEDSRKRKASSATDGKVDGTTSASTSEIPISKRSHNAIEKRYRTNLNQKIAALRDAVPSLRKLGAMMADDGDGPISAQKLNKATVLSKAIEYIRHLEGRNQRLEEENAILREGIATTEQKEDKIVTAPKEVTTEVVSNAANVELVSGSKVAQESPPAFNDPQGMIRVPEEIRRLRRGAPQAHYHERSTRPLSSSGGIEVYLGAMLRMP